MSLSVNLPMNTYDALTTTPHDRTVGSLDPAPAWMQYLKPWGHGLGPRKDLCQHDLECGVVSNFGSLQNPHSFGKIIVRSGTGMAISGHSHFLRQTRIIHPSKVGPLASVQFLYCDASVQITSDFLSIHDAKYGHRIFHLVNISNFWLMIEGYTVCYTSHWLVDSWRGVNHHPFRTWRLDLDLIRSCRGTPGGENLVGCLVLQTIQFLVQSFPFNIKYRTYRTNPLTVFGCNMSLKNLFSVGGCCSRSHKNHQKP